MRRHHAVLLVLAVFLVCQPRAATAGPDEELMPTLVVPLVEQAPDGGRSEDLWATVPSIVVNATVGKTVVPVTLSACRTAEAWFVRCTWDDPSFRSSAEPSADGSKPTSDAIALTWAGSVGNKGILEPERPRVFRTGEETTVGASGYWSNGKWTVGFRRFCLLTEGKPEKPPGGLTLTVSDPSRGIAESGPVRVRPGGAPQRRTFEEDAAGAAAKGFRSTLAGKGKPPSWLVRSDGEKGTNCLVQEAQDEENDRFPLALLEGVNAKDVDVSVRFQARKGFKDRGAGVVWRVKDEGNHYILRANVLEQNVVCFKMQDGLRIDVPAVGHEAEYGAQVKFDPKAWHTLRVLSVGDRFQAYLDGLLLYEVVDTTFPDAGGVGLWTKSDSVMAFDDLVVVPLDPPKDR